MRRILIATILALPFAFAQRAAQSRPSLVIVPALTAGLIIGIYEAITLMKDVQVPTGKFGHAIHALIYALVATFAAFNVEFVVGLIPQLQNIPLIGNVHVVRAAIGLITAIKVHAVSRVTKSNAGLPGLSETWFHTFFIGALVAAAPYIWVLINPTLPPFFQLK